MELTCLVNLSDLVGFLWDLLVKGAGWELEEKELPSGRVTLEKSYNLCETISS